MKHFISLLKKYLLNICWGLLFWHLRLMWMSNSAWTVIAWEKMNKCICTHLNMTQNIMNIPLNQIRRIKWMCTIHHVIEKHQYQNFSTHHTDQLAFLHFTVRASVAFVSSSYAVVKAPAHSHHLHVQSPGNLTQQQVNSTSLECQKSTEHLAHHIMTLLDPISQMKSPLI